MTQFLLYALILLITALLLTLLIIADNLLDKTIKRVFFITLAESISLGSMALTTFALIKYTAYVISQDALDIAETLETTVLMLMMAFLAMASGISLAKLVKEHIRRMEDKDMKIYTTGR